MAEIFSLGFFGGLVPRFRVSAVIEPVRNTHVYSGREYCAACWQYRPLLIGHYPSKLGGERLHWHAFCNFRGFHVVVSWLLDLCECSSLVAFATGKGLVSGCNSGILPLSVRRADDLMRCSAGS